MALFPAQGPPWRGRHHSAMTVRTRFAPSPTGFLHLGGARTALFAWAYARRFEGVFILRIEDTDLERSTPEAVQAIIDGMQWLVLHHDEGPFYQMQRMDRYREVLAQMLAAGSAYHCYCTPDSAPPARSRATTAPGGPSPARRCRRRRKAASRWCAFAIRWTAK